MEKLTKEIYRDRIIQAQWQIDALKFEINCLAEIEIPDFNFMTHKVSTFWPCDDSPLGMCVFNLDKYGRTLNCLYCEQPEERK